MKRKNPTLFAAGAVAILAILAYFPSLDGSYIQDDQLVVESNPIVARGDLLEIFSTDYWGNIKGNDRSLYRPVTILSFALERKITGLPSAPISRGGNITLHAFASILLLYLARRVGLTPGGSVMAALLFAVHPVHAEAVVGVVGRAEILAAMFTFLALLFYLKTGNPVSPTAARTSSWAAGAFVFLALGSKEVAIAAPALLLAADFLLLPRPRKLEIRSWLVNRLTAYAPVVMGTGLYLALRTRALESLWRLQEIPSVDNPLVLLEGTARFGTALGLLARAFRLFVFPISLSADYSGGAIRAVPGIAAPATLAGLVILLGLLFLALFPVFRKGVAPASFGACLILFPWLVVGNLGPVIGTIFAERLLYLPSAGACLLAGIVAAGALATRRRRAFVAAGLTVVFLFSVRTFIRCFDWKSEERLFEAAARVVPQSPRAHFIVGLALAERGLYADALARMEKARTVWPDFVGAWVEEATQLARLGRLGEAESRLRESIRRLPGYGAAHHNLGLVLRRQRRFGEAERELRKATICDPSLHRAWAELGHLYFEEGKFLDAARVYSRAIDLGRSDLIPRLNEAMARGGGSYSHP